MKALKFLLPILFLLLSNLAITQSQIDSSSVGKIMKVEKNDGTIYIGTIVSQDAREILLKTEKLGELYIPKHEIKSITEVKQGDLNKEGEYIPNETFATRYFITTNGLPIEKGESYMLWNLYGPEFQFGVGKNFGVGVMTSWIGIPIVGSIKYTFNVSESFNLGVGALLGTGSWASPDFFVGLPFAVATFGSRRSNLNFSGGYGFIAYNGDAEGRALFSIGGMTKIGKRASFVFDSFIVPGLEPNQEGFALIVPGFRFQTNENGAFQFGFGGLAYDGEVVPVPIPILSWFRKL